jgi:glycosyltransferase involved in cell wall biosynthesis
LAQKLPKTCRINFCGPIENSFVREKLMKYHLLFLPSKSENFGHVIAESLSVGTPVLISNNTPWRSLESKNIGWDFPLDQKENFIQIIEDYYKKIKSDTTLNRNDIIDWLNQSFDKKKLLQKHLNLFS